MNPMLLVQGAAAVSGLIGGFIPDKKKQVEHQFQTEGSDLAGRVPGAVGATTEKVFTEESYQSPLKKGLLTTSKILGAVGSIGGALMPNLKMPKLGNNAISAEASELSSTLINAKKILPMSSAIPGMTDTDIQNASEIYTPESMAGFRYR